MNMLLLEGVLLALLVAGALVPLVFVARIRVFGTRGLAALLLCGLIPAGVVATAITLRGPSLQEQQISAEDRPIEVTDAGYGYVSSKTCRVCHPGEYASWHATYHRTMTQVADSGAIMGDFEDCELHLEHLTFQLGHAGDQYWVDIHDRQEPHRAPVRRRIVLTTGSHHRQWVWMETGETRKLQALPFIYLKDQQRWVPHTAAFIHPPDNPPPGEKGLWNIMCLNCHVTAGRTRPTANEQMDTHVAEFGIACEACHGPAKQHVQAFRNPVPRYQQHWGIRQEDAIVQPEDLPADRASYVCGRCHGVTALPEQRNAKEGVVDHGHPFRPGDDLAEQVLIFGYKPHMQQTRTTHLLNLWKGYMDDRFWPDDMVRVAGRELNGLLNSPCFTHGDETRQMSCLSCHQMHKSPDDPRSTAEWANDLLKVGMRTNRACVGCHDSYEDSDALAAHTHHAGHGPAANNCYNCHMPHTTYGLLSAIRSHQVSTPSVQESLFTGRPNACNQCHLDKTLAWTADHLQEWYGTPRPELSEDEEAIAASVLWTLKGDAGQRVLMAWSMGWKAARLASDSSWMAPYLMELLNDPYDGVRMVAWKSIRNDSVFENIAFDCLAPPAERTAGIRRLYQAWRTRVGPLAGAAKPEVLINDDGTLDLDVYRRLLKHRNDRRVFLAE